VGIIGQELKEAGHCDGAQPAELAVK
jgi:hypothetical protein